jgi:MFS transporter, ACS family, glucarate transporter
VTHSQPTSAAATATRWLIVALLAALSLVSYMQRVNISIAAKLMMPELSLSEVQMGQVFSSFMVGYAIFQVPAGLLGDKLGPRIVLAVAACGWGIITILTAAIPGSLVKGGAGILSSLLALRFLLGAGEAATFPVAARAIRNWIPSSERALGNSLVLAGVPLGSAITPPLVSWLMVTWGWREAFYVTASISFVVALLWVVYAKDNPKQDGSELGSDIQLMPATPEAGVGVQASIAGSKILKDRRVLVLSLSYFFEGYVLFMFVFWFYLYLVNVRGFSILGGGIYASLPWLVALLLTPAGGWLCDLLAERRGRLGGARIVVLGAYALATTLLLFGVYATDRIVAVACLSLSVGFVMSAEAAFWSSITHVAGAHSGTASGIMNTAGILGGVISTALFPVLVKHFGWQLALASGAAVAVLCALVWLTIRPTHELATAA